MCWTHLRAPVEMLFSDLFLCETQFVSKLYFESHAECCIRIITTLTVETARYKTGARGIIRYKNSQRGRETSRTLIYCVCTCLSYALYVRYCTVSNTDHPQDRVSHLDKTWVLCWYWSQVFYWHRFRFASIFPRRVRGQNTKHFLDTAAERRRKRRYHENRKIPATLPVTPTLGGGVFGSIVTDAALVFNEMGRM